jgi:hypothetical protein
MFFGTGYIDCGILFSNQDGEDGKSAVDQREQIILLRLINQ